MKVLILNYEQVEDIIMSDTGLRNCLDALEDIYRDYGVGKTANRTRSHTYIPLLDQESHEGDRFFYHLKTLDGGSMRGGVMALRIHSGLLHHVVSLAYPEENIMPRLERSMERRNGWNWFSFLTSKTDVYWRSCLAVSSRVYG